MYLYEETGKPTRTEATAMMIMPMLINKGLPNYSYPTVSQSLQHAVYKKTTFTLSDKYPVTGPRNDGTTSAVNITIVVVCLLLLSMF